MAIMSTTKLSAQIRSIQGNATKLRAQIQEALISCAYYAVRHGEVRPFNQLLDAVGSGTRVKGLTLWAETFGFVRVKEGKFILNKTARAEADVKTEEDFAPFEDAMRQAAPWYDIVPKEVVRSQFDVSSYLTTVINKLDRENASDVVPYIQKAIDEYNQAQAIKQLALESLGEALL